MSTIPVDTWPADWHAHLGRTLTLVGHAVDAKIGALLLSDDRAHQIGLADLDAWPSAFHGQRLRVTGTLTTRADLPVFIAAPGELPRAGIPMPPGTDLDAARTRFVLANATWALDF